MNLQEQAAKLDEKLLQHENNAAERLTTAIADSRQELMTALLGITPTSSSALNYTNAERVTTLIMGKLLTRLEAIMGDDTEAAIAIGEELGSLGTDAPLSEAASASVLDHIKEYHVSLIKDLVRDLYSKILRVLRLGLIAERSLSDIAMELGQPKKDKGPFKEATTRIEAISRTETNRVANIATYKRLEDAAQYLPGLQKQWYTAKDERVRASHKSLHGKTIPVNDYFTVGGYQAKYPLDPSLPPSQSVRCRCRLIAVQGEEAKGDQMNSTFDAKLLEAEKGIASLEVERGIVLDAQGNTVLEAEGDSEVVSFNLEQLAKMRGNVFTHNHPKGRGLSPEDVDLAVTYGLAEVRAVCPKYRYSLKPGSKGWGREWYDSTVAPLVDKQRDKVNAELKRKINAGTMTVEEAEELFWHEVWRRVAKATGLAYKREIW